MTEVERTRASWSLPPLSQEDYRSRKHSQVSIITRRLVHRERSRRARQPGKKRYTRDGLVIVLYYCHQDKKVKRQEKKQTRSENLYFSASSPVSFLLFEVALDRSSHDYLEAAISRPTRPRDRLTRAFISLGYLTSPQQSFVTRSSEHFDAGGSYLTARFQLHHHHQQTTRKAHHTAGLSLKPQRHRHLTSLPHPLLPFHPSTVATTCYTHIRPPSDLAHTSPYLQPTYLSVATTVVVAVALALPSLQDQSTWPANIPSAALPRTISTRGDSDGILCDNHRI